MCCPVSMTVSSDAIEAVRGDQKAGWKALGDLQLRLHEFMAFAEIVAALDEDPLIIVFDGGIQVSTVNPAHVAAVYATLLAPGDRELGAPKGGVTIDLDTTLTFLRAIEPILSGWSDAFPYLTRGDATGLIVRQLHKFNHTTRGAVTLPPLKRWLNAAGVHSDSVRLEVVPRALRVSVDVKGQEVHRDFPVAWDGGDARSLYSLNYLSTFINAIHGSVEVIVEFAPSHPLSLTIDKGRLRAEYHLAPRIEND